MLLLVGPLMLYDSLQLWQYAILLYLHEGDSDMTTFKSGLHLYYDGLR